MSLPIRDREIKMPINRIQAQQRAETLKHKFAKNEEFYKEYREAMQQVIDKGYAELVPEDTSDNAGTCGTYGIMGCTIPTKKKLRIVYDCAAEYPQYVSEQALSTGAGHDQQSSGRSPQI